MSQANLLVLVALGSAILLFVRRRSVVALTAIVAAGIELVLGLGIVRFGIRGVPLMLILALVLAVTGAIAFAGARAKPAVAAATALTLVGAIQVVARLGLL